MITTQPQPDLAVVKRCQQASWSAGDYAVISTTLSITSELLCEAVDLRPVHRVLDVAAGNAAFATIRRFVDVPSTGYVPALLECGRALAEAERHPAHSFCSIVHLPRHGRRSSQLRRRTRLTQPIYWRQS